jgi:hypothetical protein
MDTFNVKSVWDKNYRGIPRLHTEQLSNAGTKMKRHQSASTE